MNEARDLRELRGNYGHITQQFLEDKTRFALRAGYDKPMWVRFCETLLDEGYELSLYEAKKTVSKYITVKRAGRAYKVHFSNHKPIHAKELAGDCDFFVGITHTGSRNTDDALRAVRNFFRGEPR